MDLPVAARPVVNPINPSLPLSSVAGHTHSCAFKDCCSKEEQQHNNSCCGQAHDGDSPDVDAAFFLWVILCEEKPVLFTQNRVPPLNVCSALLYL